VRTRSGVAAATATAVLALLASGAQPAWASSATGPTPASARAEAAKINLVGRDLPGWKASPDVTSSADNAERNRLASCAGTHQPSAVDVADINAPYFARGNAQVTSSVVVVRSRSDGLQDLAAMKGNKLLPCVHRIAIPYLKSQAGAGVKLSGITVNGVHPGWLPPSSFGYRISLVISGKTSSGATASEDLVSDTYGFLVRQTQIELVANQISPTGSVKPSATLEQRLVHLLVARATRFAG
jgi:hypothetical protein